MTWGHAVEIRQPNSGVKRNQENLRLVTAPRKLLVTPSRRLSPPFSMRTICVGKQHGARRNQFKDRLIKVNDHRDRRRRRPHSRLWPMCDVTNASLIMVMPAIEWTRLMTLPDETLRGNITMTRHSWSIFFRLRHTPYVSENSRGMRVITFALYFYAAIHDLYSIPRGRHS